MLVIQKKQWTSFEEETDRLLDLAEACLARDDVHIES